MYSVELVKWTWTNLKKKFDKSGSVVQFKCVEAFSIDKHFYAFLFTDFEKAKCVN